MALTVTYRKNIIDSLTGSSNTSSSSNSGLFGGGSRYIGLSFDKPKIDGTGVREPWPESHDEAHENGYGRALISAAGQSNTIKFGRANDSGVAENIEHIYFPEAIKRWTQDGETLKYFVIFNSNVEGSAASTVLAYAPLKDAEGGDGSISVNNPNTVVLFRKGDLVIKYVDIYEEEEEEE